MTSQDAREGEIASQKMTLLNAGRRGDEVTGNDETKCGGRWMKSPEMTLLNAGWGMKSQEMTSLNAGEGE